MLLCWFAERSAILIEDRVNEIRDVIMQETSQADDGKVEATTLLSVLAEQFHPSDITFAFGWLTMMGHVSVDAQNETVTANR